MNLRCAVIEIIRNISDRKFALETIEDKTVLTTDLFFDSVQIIQLIVDVEKYFGFEIEDDDLEIEKFTVFENLISIIEKNLKQRKVR